MNIFDELRKKGASQDEINLVADDLIKKLNEKGASQQEINIVKKESGAEEKPIIKSPFREFGKGLAAELPERPPTREELAFPWKDPYFMRRVGYVTGTGADLGMISPRMSLERVGVKEAGKIVKGGEKLIKRAGFEIPKLPSKGLVGRGIAKFLSFTSGVPEEDISKTLTQPKKYLRKPMTVAQETGEFGRAKDKIVKNMDDLFNFKVKTLEDEVAKATTRKIPSKLPLVEQKLAAGKPVGFTEYGAAIPEQIGYNINSSSIKSEVTKYVNDMVDRGVIDKVPNSINRLFGRIDRYATKGYSDVSGKYVKVLNFEEAHKLKQDLYKIVKDSYGIGEFDDVAANAYKTAARTINNQLRTVSPEYAQANDALKTIYDVYDEIGRKGMETFTGKGASKKFRSMFMDPEGREILRNLENVLPEGKKFMGELEALEEMQRIRKGWKAGKSAQELAGSMTIGGAIPMASQAATMFAGSAPNVLPMGIGAGIAATLSDPRLLRGTLGMAERLSAGTKLAGVPVGFFARKPTIGMTLLKSGYTNKNL